MPFIGQQPITGAYSVLDDITTSSTNTYNLLLDGGAYSPASANNLLVSLNGVIQVLVLHLQFRVHRLRSSSAL